MTLYGSTSPIAGGQISPNFGAQNGAQSAPTTALTQQPVGMPMLVAASLGLVPANALVNSINGVASGGATAIGGDPMSVLEAMNDGNGNQANGGFGGAPVAKQQSEEQQYTIGLGVVAMTENGPTSVNTDPLCIAPVPAGIPCDQWTLASQGFVG